MVGTYAEAELPAMTEAALDHFERFLAVGDPELQAWILAPAAGEGGEFADLVHGGAEVSRPILGGRGLGGQDLRRRESSRI